MNEVKTPESFDEITKDNIVIALAAWDTSNEHKGHHALIGHKVEFKGDIYYHLGTELVAHDYSEVNRGLALHKGEQLYADIKVEDLTVLDPEALLYDKINNLLEICVKVRVPRSYAMCKIAACVINDNVMTTEETFWTSEGNLDCDAIDEYTESLVKVADTNTHNWWLLSKVLDGLG